MAGRRSVVVGVVVGVLAAWLAALVVVLGAGVSAAAPASGGGPTARGTVPPEVRAAYDGELLRQVVASTQGSGGEVRVGTVHQLFSFRQEFLEGGSTADPVEAGDGWVAGVEVDGAPVGWQRTYLADDGTVGSAGWNPDPEGARAFLSTTAGALVEVPSDGAFFTLVDGVVTPVRVASWDAGLGPRSLVQVQADLAASRAQTEAAYACCRPADGCAGGAPAAGGGASGDPCGWSLPRPEVLALAAAAVALAVGVAWTALLQRRPRGPGTTPRGGAPATA